MSRLAILGGSGPLGSLLLTEALADGHQVHALTRDPRRISKTNENLSVFRGDAETGEGLEACLAGCRQVVSAIGTHRPAECALHMVRAIGTRRIDRLVFVSCVGVGDTVDQSRRVSGLLATLAPRVRRSYYQELSRAEGILRTTRLPYVLLRSTWLTDEPPGYEVVVAEPRDPPPGHLTRGDLATFILKVMSEKGWERREVTVGSKRL